MAALWNRAGHNNFALWCLLRLSFFFFSSPNLSGRSGCLPYFYTWCGLSANLGCRSETCCTRLAGNTGRKNDAKNRHLGTIAQLCLAVCLQLRHISTIGKNLLSMQYLLHMSSTCPRNIVNFGPLTAEIGSGVWSTLANFNGFRVLAALLHGILVVARLPDFTALNRRRHLYSAGRLSRWALAHILVNYLLQFSLS